MSLTKLGPVRDRLTIGPIIKSRWLDNYWVQLGHYIDGETEYDYSENHVSVSSGVKTVVVSAPLINRYGKNYGRVCFYAYNNNA